MVERGTSPLELYRLLPKTNCHKCGERNCLTLAMKLASREVSLENCLPLLEKKHAKAHERLRDLLEPAVKEVVVGVGDKAVKIGGKIVMHRHELAYFNPTAIAIEVSDDMSEDEIAGKIGKTESFCFDHVGQKLKLDLIAIRSTSNDSDRFRAAVKTAAGRSRLPLVLCSLDPKIIEAGLVEVRRSRPLLYAATQDNWKEMARLASKYECPLVVLSVNDLALLKSLTKTLLTCGVKDLVLDPGTFSDTGLIHTLNNLALIRKAVFKKGDKFLGFPLIGTPIVAWMEENGDSEELLRWREAYLANMLMVRFADILVLHNINGWALLPIVMLRQGMYNDPRKPASVQAGLRELSDPNRASPVMFTTNFALTFYTVASDIERAKIPSFLLVVDTEGIAVDSAVAGRKLTAKRIAEALSKSGVEEKVNHKTLIIPGKAARLSEDIERITGWKVLVGPKDSSAIPEFLQKHWQKAP